MSEKQPDAIKEEESEKVAEDKPSATQEEKPKEIKGAGTRFWEFLNTPLGVVVALITVAAACFQFVDWRVNSTVSNPDFMAQLAKRARPSMVFNSEGVILSDTGARSLLEGTPEVDTTSNRPAGYDVRITIRPKEMIVGEPILESLDLSNVSVTARRISGTAWEILVAYRFDVITNEYQPANLSPPRYRLELVPR
jgi:hypothetical protein